VNYPQKYFPYNTKLGWNFLLPVLSNLKFGNSFLSIMKTIENIEFQDSYLQYKKKLGQYLFAKERNTITGTYSCWTKTWCMLSPAVAWFRQNEGFVPFLLSITWFQQDDLSSSSFAHYCLVLTRRGPSVAFVLLSVWFLQDGSSLSSFAPYRSIFLCSLLLISKRQLLLIALIYH